MEMSPWSYSKKEKIQLTEGKSRNIKKTENQGKENGNVPLRLF
jgi:hypothetical protein